MVYLLGVDHQVQHQKETQISLVFAYYLAEKAKFHKVTLIGEEWFEELLAENNVETTVPQDVAKKLGIGHIFCDPNREQRRKIGWASKQDDEKREKIWLDMLKSHPNENIIFICGSDHLTSFGLLLSKSNFKFAVLPKRFDIKAYLQSSNKDLFK